jgi:hypothetical protein
MAAPKGGKEMRPTRRFPMITWTCLMTLVATSCAHSPSITRPPVVKSQQVRADLGTIGIVLAAFPPEFDVANRPSASHAAANGAAAGAGAVLQSLGSAASGSGMGALALPILAPAFILAGALIGGVIGGVAFSSQAPTEAEAEMAEAALRDAVEELKIQEAMGDLVISEIREQIGCEPVLIENRGPVKLDEAVDYGVLAKKGIDTVLEVSVRKYGLWGVRDIPILSLFMTVSTRLVRVVDGDVLHSKAHLCETKDRKLVEWGANGAQEFRKGIDFCSESIASDVVTKAFFIPVFGGDNYSGPKVLKHRVTRSHFPTVDVSEGDSAVHVPRDVKKAFHDKLSGLLYDSGRFQKGSDLQMRYRFVQYYKLSSFSGTHGAVTIETKYQDARGKEIALIQSEERIGTGAPVDSLDNAVQKCANEIAEYTKQNFRSM